MKKRPAKHRHELAQRQKYDVTGLVERQVDQVKERVQDSFRRERMRDEPGRPPRQDREEAPASDGRGARHSGSIISAAARGIPNDWTIADCDQGLRQTLGT